MIVNSDWQTILQTASDFSTVCELYPNDYTPTADGFDPADAVGLYTATDGSDFTGYSYQRLVTAFGSINRTATAEANTASVTFSNVNRVISRFEFNTGFEGLIMVIRLFSRSLSTTNAKSQILFTGRCQKPTSGTKDTLTVTADWVLGGTTVLIPRRKFTKEDPEGRTQSDPEFEGFIYLPQTGISTYSVREKRGGIAGLFGFKKTVQKTLSWSSYSNLDADKPLPEVFGRSQLQATHLGYIDIGTSLEITSAFCEGEVHSVYSNDATHPDHAKSLDSRIPLDYSSYALCKGLVGASNTKDAGWVAPGYYSRTCYLRCKGNNSTIDGVDPAPDIVGIIEGRLVTIPDSGGSWVTTGTYSDNAAAIVRFLLTDDNYFKLDANWIDDDEFYTAYKYNADLIIDRSLTDFAFLTGS